MPIASTQSAFEIFIKFDGPPVQVLWLDDVITLNGFHAAGGWKLARHATLANFSSDRASKAAYGAAILKA